MSQSEVGSAKGGGDEHPDWAVAAAHYGRAFTRGEQTYPYFSNPAA